MRFTTIRLRTSYRVAAFVTLMLVSTLGAPAAVAVDYRRLSIAAEGATAARAIFNLHPDANVRNEDFMAMAMVHPAYWHYSSLTDDFEGAHEVMKAFGWTPDFPATGLPSPVQSEALAAPAH